MAESYLLKRMFRNCALISGLIEKRHPGQEKTGRQVTVSTDLIYDVLRQPRARPHPPAGDLGGRGDRAARHRPPRRDAVAHQGPNRAQAARPDLAAGGAGDARDRPRGGGRRRGRARHVLREAAEDLVREAMGEMMLTASHSCTRRQSHAAGGVRASPIRPWSASPASCSRPSPRARCGGRERAAARRRRPPSREGLVLRPARPVAAALRHRRDARPARARSSRALAAARRSSPSATASTTTTAPRRLPPHDRDDRSPRCSAAATGSGSPATTTPSWPGGLAGSARRRTRRRAADLPPRAARRARPGEIAGHLHPAARVAGRGRSVRRRCFAGDGHRLDPAGLRRLCRRPQRARPRLRRAVPAGNLPRLRPRRGAGLSGRPAGARRRLRPC